jgi:hypothetical protein
MTIASRDVLPSLSINQILKVGEYSKAADNHDVVLIDNWTPQAFTVSAVLQQDDSYLWIGVRDADPKKTHAMVIVKGDALRELVTHFLKHLNAPIFAGEGGRL